MSTTSRTDAAEELLLRARKVLHDLESGNFPKPARIAALRAAAQAYARASSQVTLRLSARIDPDSEDLIVPIVEKISPPPLDGN